MPRKLLTKQKEDNNKPGSPPTRGDGDDDNDDNDEDVDGSVDDDDMSPKMGAMLSLIQEEMKPDEKGVIFSQWTSHLDIIQRVLIDHRFAVTRIDGTMNATERVEAMEDFSSNEEGSPRFMLCSLHACGTGITLNRANYVFTMDPYWNKAVEQQAFGRVHRIGQTRQVKVIRLIMKDSIEERFLNLQNAKEALGKGSLQKLSKEDRQKVSLPLGF